MESPNISNYENYKIDKTLAVNIKNLKSLTGNTSDLLSNEVNVLGHSVAITWIEGMVSTSILTDIVLYPLDNIESIVSTPEKLFDYMKNRMMITVERIETDNFGDICRCLMSGFAVIIIDGVAKALALGVQGFAVKGISEPSGEGNVKGSHEGFTEQVRTNISLIRRRIKSPSLCFKLFQIGKTSKTDVSLAYLVDKVPPNMISEIKSRLNEMDLETILTSGYVQPFLEKHNTSIFSSISTTERPDSVCAKILEGRVALILDGTPFVLIIPYLFIENFQAIDDYADKPFSATYIR